MSRRGGPIISRLETRSIALLTLVAGAACGGSGFIAVHSTEPIAAAVPAVRAEVAQLRVTGDLLESGMGDGSGLAVDLVLTNTGARAWNVSAGAMSCAMELDTGRPELTLTLTPDAGGEGPFPIGLPVDDLTVATLAIPPGQTRRYWVLLRGYKFPDSEVPRRTTLRIPTDGGPPLELVLADPGRGTLSWQVPAASSGWSVGLQDASLFSSHLRATVVSTEIVRRAWLRRLIWEVGFTSTLLVETHGDLISATSSFTGIGLVAAAALPVATWGRAQDPNRFGFYLGGSGLALPELPQQPPADSTAKPHFYGALTVEGGVAFDIGSLRLAATPFPLSARGPSVPRWSIRVGYTHWWVGGGGTDGYTSSFRIAW